MNFSGIKIWFLERFPPIHFISGVFIYLLPKSLASLLLYSQQHIFLSWTRADLFAALIPGFHLLILRVFDEHKDFESDKIHNPNRSLQKGIVTLSQVRNVGICALLLQLLCFFILKPSLEIGLIYFAVWVWTLLMWKLSYVAMAMSTPLPLMPAA